MFVFFNPLGGGGGGGGGGGVLILINPFGWRGELRVKFFPRNYIKLNYECHQSQSTLHVLVCPGAII